MMSQEEAFALGFHDVPDARTLAAMSFVELAAELSSSKPGTPKHMVIEREMKRALAKDQAKANRSNIYIGTVIAGIFGLSGVVIGWWLRETSSVQNPAHTNSLNQVQQTGFSHEPMVSNPAPVQPIASKPVANPPPANRNNGNTNNVP